MIGIEGRAPRAPFILKLPRKIRDPELLKNPRPDHAEFVSHPTQIQVSNKLIVPLAKGLDVKGNRLDFLRNLLSNVIMKRIPVWAVKALLASFDKRFAHSIGPTFHRSWRLSDSTWDQHPCSFREHIVNLPHNSIGPLNRGSDHGLRSGAWLGIKQVLGSLQMPRDENPRYDGKHAFAAFVHPGILSLSPFVRLQREA